MQWADIDARHDPDPARHCAAVAAAGVDIPLDVFEQLFHEPDSDRRLGYLLREIDWSDIVWRESHLSGAALVEVQIPREYEHAVEEARANVLVEGLQDDRPDVVQHWRDHGSWFRSPVLVTGDVIGPAVAYELLVGFTRLGNLLGLMDRDEVPVGKLHRVWIGHRVTG